MESNASPSSLWSKKSAAILACLLSVLLIITFTPSIAFGKTISSTSRAISLAKGVVGKSAVVRDVDMDYENGTKVYEVELRKGSKNYSLVYRAKDSKLIEYDWELRSKLSQKRYGTNLKKTTIQKKAKKRVSGAKITSTVLKRDDGLSVYKIYMKKSTKTYTLEYNAKSGSLIEYKWKITSSSSSSKYIGTTKAKSIAKKNVVSGATVRSCKFEIDDGIPTYEVKLTKGVWEYEVVVHARTGRVLEIDRDSIYD